MTNTSSALTTALAYFHAWTEQSFAAAMEFVSEDIVGLSPAGPINGGPAWRAFMEPFSRLVTSSDLLAAFGDDEVAVLIYNTVTAPVPFAPGAERLTVAGGKITGIQIIFDRLPFAEARRDAG